MTKFLDYSVPKGRPIEYILIKENNLQDIAGFARTAKETPVDKCSQANSSFPSFNDLGKRLLSAASEGNIHEARYLLTQGTQFITDWVGTTPLHLAAQNNHVEICEMFIKAGMCNDFRNKVDRTPLHMAATAGHYQVAEVLIKHGVDINPRDMLHMTPLHWAAQNGHTAMVELLLRHGAHTNIRNKFSLTPQDIANQIHKLEIVELLQAYESDSQTLPQDLVVPLLESADRANDTMELGDDTNQVTEISHPVIVLDDVESVDRELDDPSINSDPAHPVIVLDDVENGDRGLDDPSINSDPGPIIINLEDSIAQDDLITHTENKRQSPESGEQVAAPIFTSIDTTLDSTESQDNESSFSAIKLLQEHGISMLPNDNEDSNLLNTVVASGHSVVLTEVGKEMLKSLNAQAKTDHIVPKPKAKKIPHTDAGTVYIFNGRIFDAAKNQRQGHDHKTQHTPDGYKKEQSRTVC